MKKKSRKEEEMVEVELELPEELVKSINKFCKKEKITFDEFVHRALSVLKDIKI